MRLSCAYLELQCMRNTSSNTWEKQSFLSKRWQSTIRPRIFRKVCNSFLSFLTLSISLFFLYIKIVQLKTIPPNQLTQPETCHISKILSRLLQCPHQAYNMKKKKKTDNNISCDQLWSAKEFTKMLGQYSISKCIWSVDE